MEHQDQGEEALEAFVDHLVAVSRHFSAFERQQVCCGTVTAQQCVVLQLLRQGPVDVSTLASQAGSSPSAMTRLLDGLVQRGLVHRGRSERDRRVVRVELTDVGVAEALRLRERTKDAVRAVLAEIPEDKRGQVAESFLLVQDAMARARQHLQASG